MSILRATGHNYTRAHMAVNLAPELIADYRRDGAVCVRGAFSADEVGLVEAGIERNLADPSPRGIVASRAEDAGRFFEDFCNWDRIAEYERFIRDVGGRGRSPGR